MKKGFTLIELLSVIVILGVIALIAVPTVGSIVTDSKINLYKEQVQSILKATDRWIVDNDILLSEKVTGITLGNLGNTCRIDIPEDNENFLLIKEGYLKPTDLRDPITGNNLLGYIIISWNNNQYEAKYYNNDDKHTGNDYMTDFEEGSYAAELTPLCK